jgi:hypothetical protein
MCRCWTPRLRPSTAPAAARRCALARRFELLACVCRALGAWAFSDGLGAPLRACLTRAATARRAASGGGARDAAAAGAPGHVDARGRHFGDEHQPQHEVSGAAGACARSAKLLVAATTLRVHVSRRARQLRAQCARRCAA